MKIDDVKQLRSVSRRLLDAAAQELARADARHQAAQQALALHRERMMGELERGRDPNLWPGVHCWYAAAESQLDELRAITGRLEGEAVVAREALGEAAKEAEQFEAVTADLTAERKAEVKRRVQHQLDEAALRLRRGDLAQRS